MLPRDSVDAFIALVLGLQNKMSQLLLQQETSLGERRKQSHLLLQKQAESMAPGRCFKDADVVCAVWAIWLRHSASCSPKCLYSAEICVSP